MTHMYANESWSFVTRSNLIIERGCHCAAKQRASCRVGQFWIFNSITLSPQTTCFLGKISKGYPICPVFISKQSRFWNPGRTPQHKRKKVRIMSKPIVYAVMPLLPLLSKSFSHRKNINMVRISHVLRFRSSNSLMVFLRDWQNWSYRSFSSSRKARVLCTPP